MKQEKSVGAHHAWVRIVGSVFDAWFDPKRFENAAFYERVGIRFFKKYVPTGGDVANRAVWRKFGSRTIDRKGGMHSLKTYELFTRIFEGVHLVVFILCVSFSVTELIQHHKGYLQFAGAGAFYLLITVYPVMLQRYNRIRLYRAMQMVQRRRPSTPHVAS